MSNQIIHCPGCGIPTEDIIATKHRYLGASVASTLGAMTIIDVLGANHAEEHHRKVTEWAGGVWSAWQCHHDHIASWFDRL